MQCSSRNASTEPSAFYGDPYSESILQILLNSFNLFSSGARAPPIALDGPAVTIRKFPEPITMEKLIRFGSISGEAAGCLKNLVTAGYNIFISGGTNSGKSTFLNALTACIPAEERLVTVEDSAELQIRAVPNLVRLEEIGRAHV